MIKIALVGYGYWGPNVARNLYANKNYEFKTICDKKSVRLEKAKTLYAEAVTYTENFNDIINDDEIDAVALAVETSAHYELAKQALNAGKHIYVEKPFTDNVAEAVELRNLAKEKNLKIHVDHIMVYHPVINKIKELIDSGELGEIIYFDCSRINLGQLKNDVSAMWDLSVHDLSIIDYLTNGSEPNKVQAIGQRSYSKKESVTFLTLQYDTFLASITASWLSPIKERRIMIAGTKKMLVYDDVDVLNKLIVYDKGFDRIEDMEYGDYVVKTRSGEGIIPKLEQSDALFNSLEHFRQSIVNNTESKTNAEAAIRIIKILEAADKSLEE
ncbi:MAG: Gfo/Idh/MocA family oxidoreductase [Bacillota bacterium]|nr:Gfo/Idh/MocA family oxidoreductase [Bacillota bacterium]